MIVSVSSGFYRVMPHPNIKKNLFDLRIGLRSPALGTLIHLVIVVFYWRKAFLIL